MLSKIWNRVTGKASQPRARQAQARQPRRVYQPGLEPLETRDLMATFVVTDLSDSGPQTLRWAIEQANLTRAPDTITFSAPKPGTIRLTSPLPMITQPLTIDGSKSGPCDPPGIEIDGSGAGFGANGIVLIGGASSSTVRGLAINGFSGSGVVLIGVSGVQVVGNHIGTNVAGTAAKANDGSGVWLDYASGNTIGGTSCTDGNVISANRGHGVFLRGSGTTNNRVIGNKIGTDVTGTAALGNSRDGVQTYLGAHHNTIGGAASAANVISANGGDGVELGTHDNTVSYNYIGVTVRGTAELRNGAADVRIGGRANTVEKNVVSASAVGIITVGLLATATLVKSRLARTEATRATSLGNTTAGIQTNVEADSDMIQGSTSPKNDPGIYVGSNLNDVQGNRSGAIISSDGRLDSSFIVDSGSYDVPPPRT